jgi:eukaryotic translation initiation factor 2C
MEGQDKLQETGLESQLASCFSSSCKSLVFPSRPSYGKLGTKCVVKANYFLADISVSDLSHYHVSHLECSYNFRV